MTAKCDPVVKGKARNAEVICRGPAHKPVRIVGLSRRYANVIARLHRAAS